MTAESLPLTGERTVPGVPEENYWFRRHEIAYLALARYCRDAVVLEAGCGEGYGANLLSETAQSVAALDYDEPTVRHVARRYPLVNSLRGNLAHLPLRAGSIDVVVSSQVIEHLWDQEGFLAECLRVLRPGGTLLITTPNRITFSSGRDTPLNPFHTRELSAVELSGLLRGAGFSLARLAGVHHGARLRAMDERHGGSFIAAQLHAVMGQPPGQSTLPDGLLTEIMSVRAEDFEIQGRNIDASLDLLAVAVRP